MKRKGVLIFTCFGIPSIKFDDGGSMGIDWIKVPKGFNNKDRVEITLIEVNGSATWNMEHEI